MIIDSSPLVAIALDEPGCEAYQRAILQSKSRIASAATIFEASGVLMKRYGAAAAFVRMDTLVKLLRITVVPFGAADALRARAVYARCGKGVHPARLNLMDCISYALAERMGEPLLYVGNDFAQTPLVS